MFTNLTWAALGANPGLLKYYLNELRLQRFKTAEELTYPLRNVQ
jgi:hypothetical protein